MPKAQKANAKDAETRGRYKLSRALVELTCSHVFHSSIIMRLRREERDTSPFVMGTDGIRLLVNPAMLDRFSVFELTAILAHEAIHVAGCHPLRRAHRQPLGWNIACDAVVNQIVNEGGFTLPVGCVPPMPNETPERLFEELEEQAKAAQGRFDELSDPTHEDGSKLSEADRQALEQETKQWVESAAQAAKRAGQLGAGLERFVKNALRSVVPWREVLARFVSEKRLSDYSWARPNRRYTAFDIYLPKLEARDVPKVAVAPDTSGSISPDMIERVVAEVVAVLDMMGGSEATEVPVLWFDADVYPQIVTDASELKVQGGGGTDYAPVMRWVAKHQGEWDFKGLVVVTDGCCESFGEAPPCDVLWVLTGENDSFRPPYGELALVIEGT